MTDESVENPSSPFRTTDMLELTDAITFANGQHALALAKLKENPQDEDAMGQLEFSRAELSVLAQLMVAWGNGLSLSLGGNLDDDSNGSKEAPRRTRQATASGILLHIQMKKYFLARRARDKANATAPPCGSDASAPETQMSAALDRLADFCNEDLRQTVSRFLDADDILSAQHAFFPEYTIKYQIGEVVCASAIIDLVVHVENANEVYVYDWKFFNEKSAKSATRNNKQVQLYVELVSQETGLNVSGYLVVFRTEKSTADPTIIPITRMEEKERAIYKIKPRLVSDTEIRLPQAQT